MPDIQDILTVLYLLCSGVLVFNIAALIRDRDVKGVSLVPVTLFTATNAIEVPYFAANGDYLLAIGAGTMAILNLIWFVLAAIFRFERDSLANL